jgi:hypothetical protein
MLIHGLLMRKKRKAMVKCRGVAAYYSVFIFSSMESSSTEGGEELHSILL